MQKTENEINIGYMWPLHVFSSKNNIMFFTHLSFWTLILRLSVGVCHKEMKILENFGQYQTAANFLDNKFLRTWQIRRFITLCVT